MSDTRAGQPSERTPGAGWKGTPPADGTRRKLIRDAASNILHSPTLGEGSCDEVALCIADEVEAALLGSGDDEREADAVAALAKCYRLTGADPSDGSDAMLAREAVDEVRRFRKEYDELEEAINAVGEALDRIDAPQGATYAERIDRLYREMREKLDVADVRHRIDKGRLVDFDRVHNLLDGWEIRRTTDEDATRSLYDRARELIERLRRTEEDLDTAGEETDA